MKRSAVKAMRTREKNDAYDSDLAKHLAYLSSKQDKAIRAVNRDLKQLAASLRQAGVQDIQTSVSLPSSAGSMRSRSSSITPMVKNRSLSLPRVSQLRGCYGSVQRDTPFAWMELETTTSRSRTLKSPTRKLVFASSGEHGVCSCRIDPERKIKCVHFPCIRPATYHQFGYPSEIDGSATTRVKAMSANSKKRLQNAVEQTSLRRPLRSNVINKLDIRVNSLKKFVAHMRVKNEQTKPGEWRLNYGRPTPLRKVLKAAR